MKLRNKKYFFLILAYLGAFFLLVAVNYIANAYDFRMDLTRGKQHTLTETTQSILEELSSHINMTALYAGVPPKALVDMLNEYSRLSQGKISADIVDPLVNIGYASRFGNIIKGEEKKIIIECGQQRTDIDFTETPLSEEELTNGIIRVTRKVQHVYFLTGHGENDPSNQEETGYSILAKQLLANNILSKKLFLEQIGKIPEDCDVLVIAGPQNNLSEEEREIILKYLREGGDALFLIEHVLITTPDKPLTESQKDKNPSLNEILHQWGVHVEDDVVVDLGSHASGDVGSPATKNYLSHEGLIQGLDYTFYIRPRSIVSFGKKRPTIKKVPFVLTASEKLSWGEKNRTLQIKYDPGEDNPGPVPISYVIWEPKNREKESDTRMIVFTDSDFLTNVYIESYSNARMGLNLIQWLSEPDYKVFLDKNQIKTDKIELTSHQKRFVLFILCAVPLFIICLGFFIYFKNRG